MKVHNPILLSFIFCLVLKTAFGCNKYFGLPGLGYGTQKLPGLSCADILATKCGEIDDGIYWIKLKGQTTSFPVFCNMAAGGWTLVFKVVSGITGRPATIWDMSVSTYEFSLAALNAKKSFKHHYKNRIVQNWSGIGFLLRILVSVFGYSVGVFARVVLYKRGIEEVALRFNALNSNNRNWFSQANILDSPWQDILTVNKNHFILVGPCFGGGCRDFHINHAYGGCPKDDGWLSVGDCNYCKWEQRLPAGMKIVYSKIATHSNYNVYSTID